MLVWYDEKRLTYEVKYYYGALENLPLSFSYYAREGYYSGPWTENGIEYNIVNGQMWQ